MFFNRILRNLLFVLYVVYYLQGALYVTGSIISQSSLFLILLVSSFYFFKAYLLKGNMPLFFNLWTLLLITNVVYFVFTSNLENTQHISMFKGVLFCMLSFYPFYYFSRINLLPSKILFRFSLVLLPVFIINFYLQRQLKIDSLDYHTENIVNNTSYLFVGLISYLFLEKKNFFLTKILFVVLIVFVLGGVKRGAILSCFFGLILFVYHLFKNGQIKNKFKNNLLLIVGVISLVYFIYVQILENEFLLKRINLMLSGDSSSRDSLVGGILEFYYNSDSYINYFFGFGFAASVDIVGDYAHNDWIELLSNFGFLGVIIYLMLFYSMFSFYKKIYNYKYLYITLCGLWFLGTLFSMRYFAIDGFMETILFGFLFGKQNVEALRT